ncbi:hypothetical protein GCM10022378_09080 [Salinicoccus jeotgali]|uniref:Uncharacterized protein n=1 Tax=Salinicoccus jeotgali TaxID=381634 RepID=A0ABP7ELV7_9STAP
MIGSDKKPYLKDVTLRLIQYCWKSNMTDFKSAIIQVIEAGQTLTMNRAKFFKQCPCFWKKRDKRYETANEECN